MSSFLISFLHTDKRIRSNKIKRCFTDENRRMERELSSAK